MIVAGVLSVGPWIAVDSQWRGFSIAELGVPLGPKDPWCSQSYSREWHEMKWHQINWGGSMAYDIVVLVLVILRLQQLPKVEKHSNSIDMRTYILKSNLGYFLVSFAINFASFIAQMTVTNIDIAVSISKNSKFLPDPTADRPFFFSLLKSKCQPHSLLPCLPSLPLELFSKPLNIHLLLLQPPLRSVTRSTRSGKASDLMELVEPVEKLWSLITNPNLKSTKRTETRIASLKERTIV